MLIMICNLDKRIMTDFIGATSKYMEENAIVLHNLFIIGIKMAVHLWDTHTLWKNIEL